MKSSTKWILAAALFLVFLGLLSVSQELVATKHNRTLVSKTQVKLSGKLSFLSMNLIVLGTIQLIAVCFLITQAKKTSLVVQSEEITEALDGLDVSRLIRKRDGLSQQELLAIMRNLALELLDSKKILAYVIERGVDVVCVIGRDGCLSSVSRSSLTSWGYTPQELEGLPAGQLVSETFISELKRTAKTGQRAVQETTLRSRDGEELHVVWTAYWSDAEETLFCVIEDVTLRKKAEEQLRFILNALPAGVLVTSGDPPVIEFGNTLACHLLSTDRNKLHMCKLDQVWEVDTQSKSQGSESSYRALARRPDESTFPVEITMRSIEFDGQIKQLFVFLDISSKEEIEKIKSEFLAMVTHDLKTPLATLRGVVLLLDKELLGSLNEKGKTLIAKVSRDFERLDRLINEMLELEKIGAGKLPLECSSLTVAELVEQAEAAVSLHAIAKSINIEIECQATEQCWGDRDQLVRVLVNLLSNGLKYSPDKETITVKVEKQNTDIKIAVVDHGKGIPEEKLDQIFEKFEQSELADAKKHGGTGLGLAICKAIVQEHGGQIGAFNNPNGGSTFWFTIAGQQPAES